MTAPQLKINRTDPAEPTRNNLSGMNVTEAGEGVLQTPCGEFDSHRLQILPLASRWAIPLSTTLSIGEIVMIRVLRNRTAAVNCHSTRQLISGTRFVSTNNTRKDHDYVSAKKRVKTTRKRTTILAA
ncbi:hypothetical protein BH10CYA1_BH10CYA1_00460 [soil metagenome]